MLRFLKPLEEVVFPSRPEHIRRARTMVVRLAQECGLSTERIDLLELAVGEACANAVEHGSPKGNRNRITVRCSKGQGLLTIDITDQGCWTEPKRKRRGEVPLRGRGIPLMMELVDEVEIAPTPTGTRVRLSMRIPIRRRTARRAVQAA